MDIHRMYFYYYLKKFNSYITAMMSTTIGSYIIGLSAIEKADDKQDRLLLQRISLRLIHYPLVQHITNKETHIA